MRQERDRPLRWVQMACATIWALFLFFLVDSQEKTEEMGFQYASNASTSSQKLKEIMSYISSVQDNGGQ